MRDVPLEVVSLLDDLDTFLADVSHLRRLGSV
jgi:hypothetical protein